jgi:predicted GIY-YIG superfamily endonuclease
MNCVYLLMSDHHTYIGATCDPDRRLRQHNGVLKGGARATRGKVWTRILYVSGFPTWSEALKFEWKWKRCGRGINGRVRGLATLLSSGKSTASSIPFASYNSPLRVITNGDCGVDISPVAMICASESEGAYIFTKMM